MIVRHQVRTHSFLIAASLRSAALLALTALAFAASASAQTDTWLGGTGNWSQASRWSSGVPTSSSNVMVMGAIPGGTANLTLDQTPTTIASLDLERGESPDGFFPTATLTLPGDSAVNQSAAVSLTVNGTSAFDDDTEVGIGAGSSLTLNGASTNNGTINLSSVTLQVGTAPILASLNGSGTLTNNGAIQGNNSSSGLSGGIITVNIVNNNAAEASLTGALTLSGNTVTGGSFNAGSLTSFGATLNGVTLGAPHGVQSMTSANINLTGGSTLTVQGALVNDGTLNLGTGHIGATITPFSSTTGTILNAGFITGGGTIAPTIFNDGTIEATNSSVPLVLQGLVIGNGGGDIPGSVIILESGTSLVLDGADVEENVIRGNGGTITGKNGATLGGDTLIGTSSPVVIAGGSSLGLTGGLQVQGVLQLGSSTQGANLTDADDIGTPSLELQTGATLQGGGTVAATIDNDGAIIANNASAALVLMGNVTGEGTIAVNSGATLTLDPITVSAGSVTISAGSTLNGSGDITSLGIDGVRNAGTIAPGAGAPGEISIRGTYEQQTGGALDFLLGGTGAGQFSQLHIIDDAEPGLGMLSPGAFFDPGTSIDAEFFGGFDPSSGCTTVFGVCESFDVFDIDGGSISGLGNITFDLPTLPTGFTWLELAPSNEEGQEIVLEIEGAVSSTGGGDGGGNGTTTTPEPGTLALLSLGLIAIGYAARRRSQSRP